jgi:hypothetical protein
MSFFLSFYSVNTLDIEGSESTKTENGKLYKAVPHTYAGIFPNYKNVTSSI